tara:strand:- start:46 stop:1998 length:1953 start_codon:yes stop_codon:yes gene_type:complete
VLKKSKLRYIIRKIIQEQESIEDVPDKVKPDDGSGEPPAPTFYCDDPEAINYTPNAPVGLIDNSVCVYENELPPPSKKLGCKNPNDINYCAECISDTNPTSCAGIRKEKDKPGKLGCMDNGKRPYSEYPGYAACNYDPDAEVNSECEYDSCMGCMVSSAQFYDPTATIPCPNDECCGGRREDPIDLSPPISGCTNPSADNYNEEAVEDDGSCEYGSVTYEGNNIIYDGLVGRLQLLFDQGPCGPNGDNPDIYPDETNNFDGPPWCGGNQCTCIVDDIEESIIPDSVWGLMDNVCSFIQNMSLGQDIVDLPGEMFDYDLHQLPGVSSWISETNETFLENNPDADLTPNDVLEMVTSFEDYLEGALGFGIACENGQWNGIYNEDNTWDEVLITTDWLNPAALPGQILETIAYLTCQIDIAMCNGGINIFNQLPQDGPGGCDSSGCECCKHPYWGLCPGAIGTTYTIEGIFDELNLPQEVRDQINVDQNKINTICQYFPVYDGQDGDDWWAWWNSHQVGNSWLATIDNISPTGNLPCGWGSNIAVQQSGFCPEGLQCLPCDFLNSSQQETIGIQQTCEQLAYACMPFDNITIVNEASASTPAAASVLQEDFTSFGYKNYDTRNYHNIRNFKKIISKDTVKTRLQELAGIRKKK